MTGVQTCALPISTALDGGIDLGVQLPTRSVLNAVRDWENAALLGWELDAKVYTAVKSRGDAAIRSVMKPTFGSVELGEYLVDKSHDAGIEEIVLVGLCTDICVISNALLIKAFLPEVKVTVDAACCAGVTPESHENALRAMRMCQVNIENWEG